MNRPAAGQLAALPGDFEPGHAVPRRRHVEDDPLAWMVCDDLARELQNAELANRRGRTNQRPHRKVVERELRERGRSEHRRSGFGHCAARVEYDVLQATRPIAEHSSRSRTVSKLDVDRFAFRFRCGEREPRRHRGLAYATLSGDEYSRRERNVLPES